MIWEIEIENINKFKNEIKEDEKKLLYDTLNKLEYIIIKFLNDKQNYQNFLNACNYAFEIMNILQIPKNSLEKIFHVLFIICYAYLGEKKYRLQDYFKKNSKSLKINEEINDWNIYVLKRIYETILNISLIGTYKDYDEAILIIENLVKEQKEKEKPFLENIKNQNEQKLMIHLLASLYHLASSVKIVAFSKKNEFLPNLEENLKYSENHIKESRNLELNLIIPLLKETLIKIFNEQKTRSC